MGAHRDVDCDDDADYRGADDDLHHPHGVKGTLHYVCIILL
jgi:hypothetical protein